MIATIPEAQMPTPAVDLQAAGKRRHRRSVTAVWIGRIALAVIVIGGWQWFTTEGWVDKFFFGQPSEIWNSLVRLFTKGTAFGSIWENLWVTAKEAFGGFLLGTAGRRRASASCWARTGTCRTVVGPYIRIVNSIPRIILGSIFIVAFGLGHVPEDPARRRAGVLHRVLQRVPGRPRGRSEPHRERAGARRLAGPGRDAT